MNDREKFLLDLQGFLVIQNFLTPREVQAINKAIDANQDKSVDDPNVETGGRMDDRNKRGQFSGMLTWEQPFCQPFRDLLAHPKLVPYLDTLFGRGWKLDHAPLILTSKADAEGLRIHGATSYQFNGSAHYTYSNGTIRCGMTVFQYQLADINPGDGGLCVISGSHKSNFQCPDDIRVWEGNQEVVYNVPVKAGDLVIFPEATLHGTLPWKGKQERRSLLYRYSPKYLNFDGGYYQTSMPEWIGELTEAEQAVLEPPYMYNRPLVEKDGVTVVRPRVG